MSNMVNKATREDDLAFLMGAMTRITGSLDMQTALIETFDFLSEHFPIEAISLHQYSPQLRSLKLLFLVQKGRFDFVETVVPIPEEEAGNLLMHHKGVTRLTRTSQISNEPVVEAHGRALAHLIPYKKRSYLVGTLRSEIETIGHLCFMGTHENCFTEEHERKLKHLLTPFALTMTNLLQYKRTIEFQRKLNEENKELQRDLDFLRGKRIVGEQNGLRKTMEIVQQLKGREVPALILGETGTGKELIADVIQSISPRKDKPFIKVNCGAIPDSLVDSELFGYEKGAFTGATTSKPGRFEQAHGGTLFLDEIGELPLQAQVRLLRVLQNNVVERLGSTKSIEVDVRVIAATNRNLELMLQEGTFREDLYYRLYVFPIHLPPLRNRTGDIPELIYHFLKSACDELEISPLPEIPKATTERLLKYSWPGNVRELENLVKRGVTLSPQGPLLLEELLPQDEGWYIEPEESQSYFEKSIDARVEAVLEAHLAKLNLPIPIAQNALPPAAESTPVVQTLEEANRTAIMNALSATSGKIHGPGGAAELLDINASTLRSKIRKLGITTEKK
ncbi:sigma-54 interaction domain-containing protein [Halodesulfovibrio marinisediminis]|uniref:Transcriptional regulator containing GAF, AAA-type ATPase, and DNA-binding Fis domains n=1 Tax=Halodesulfovibrio marinisediminis DSM 17456 TaxID=1121457 RepID=A0A1N6E9R1_9BACT|nr:sigma 54-interacting transcriptional regulator [Halodesulfovibrio marinisediminis]SIN79764.1 Transcriptional regulator containing GAF, AAA-type ATPase, and DNA-binding Fis domains [Halodesulfovibrio marinisediminis DSM 17456]